MKKLLLIISLAGTVATANGQWLKADSARTFIATEIYFRDRGDELAVYNGPRAPVYPPVINGVPFLPDKSFRPGSVFYDGIWYHDFPLRFDRVAGELTIQRKDLNGIPSVVFSGRVGRFVIGEADFVNLEKKSGLSGAGYYQVMIQGKVSLFVKRRMVITEFVADPYRSGTVQKDFESRDEYYVYKDSSYHAIRKKKELMDLLKEKRKEVTRLMGPAKISYRKNPEQYIMAACRFYNQLTN